MDREEFEQLVAESLDALPPEFLTKLDNVEVVVEYWPSPEQSKSVGLTRHSLLFGLYQGVPTIKRTKGVILPDKITIFAGSILRVCRTKEEVRQKVSEVVRHEIAHHFGMDEKSIQKKGY